jgi:hypothetical protein
MPFSATANQTAENIMTVDVPNPDSVAHRADEEHQEREYRKPIPYFGRAAVCFLAVGPDGDDQQLYEDLVNTLKADPRVETVDSPAASRQEFSRPTLTSFGSFTDDESVDEGEAPDPFSHLHFFTFGRPILLEIRSPKRLQRQYAGFKQIPTDKYWAAWDGITLVVVWEIERVHGRAIDENDFFRALSPSAGLLVQDVLKEAAEKAGTEFRTIACSPNCDYTFSHSNLVLNTVGEDEETVFSAEEGVIEVDLGSEHAPGVAARELYQAVSFVGRAFARVRSDSRTMQSAAWHTHIDVAKLLQLDYERAVLGAKPFLKALPERWKSRRWRRIARQLVAQISLDLATLEHVRADLARFRKIYDDAAQDANSGLVFKHEYELGLGIISTIEVSEARSAVDRVTASLDTRALVLATSLGAIVGALIGAVVGTLL